MVVVAAHELQCTGVCYTLQTPILNQGRSLGDVHVQTAIREQQGLYEKELPCVCNACYVPGTLPSW